jgi:hypothetical protein
MDDNGDLSDGEDDLVRALIICTVLCTYARYGDFHRSNRPCSYTRARPTVVLLNFDYGIIYQQ